MAEVQEVLVEVKSSTILSGHDQSKVSSRPGYFLLPRSANSPIPSSPAVVIPIPETALNVDFCKSWSGRPNLWQRWVDKLRPVHEAVWQEIGILDCLVSSAARRCKRDDTVLLEIAKFWSPRTNTFIFPWGEATVTLEDLAVLGGLPVIGSSVRDKPLPEIQEDVRELERVRWILNDSKYKKPTFSGWANHFLNCMTTDGTRERIEHAAFLAMWLSMSVLKEAPFDVVHPNVFSIAARMARGQGVALAPAALASLYKGLSSLKLHISIRDEEKFVVGTPLNVLQLWIWERFPALRAKSEVSSQEGLDSITVRGELESPTEFKWIPYRRPSVALRGCWVSADDIARSRELQSFGRYIRACDLVGMYYTEKYHPHRVARQLGFDQDVPGTVARTCSKWKESWRRYDLNPRSITFFVPDSEPGITIDYMKWWKNFSCNKGISKKTLMATAIREGASTSTDPGIGIKRRGRTHRQNKELKAEKNPKALP